MFKKKDLIIFIVLLALTIATAAFLASYRTSFSVGGVAATIDNATNTIFVSLPEGSDTAQEITFNFPYQKGPIYISRIPQEKETKGIQALEDTTGPGGSSTTAPNQEGTGKPGQDGDIASTRNTGEIKNPDGGHTMLESGDNYDFSSFISHSKVETASGDKYDLWVTTGDVPIIFIDTEDDIPDEPKVDCTLDVLSSNPSNLTAGIDGEIELTGVSDNIPKSSYSLNIAEDPLTGETPEVPGFPYSKRFSLSACYLDRSFLRQKLACDMFSIMGNTSPASTYAELYVNGSYSGLYLVSARVDRDMFSIANYDPENKYPGTIYEASGWRADFSRGIEGFSQVEPDLDSETSYTGPLEELIDLAANVPQDEFLEQVENTLDMENAIDSHILYLISGCQDPRAANQYIYRKDGSGSKLSFCPGSIYQGSFGRDPYSFKVEAGTSFYGSMLFNRLYDEESYREALKSRYNSLRSGALSYESLVSLIDRSTAGLSGAWQRNFSAWPISALAYEDSMEPGEDVAYIKQYLKDRLSFLDEYMNNPPIFKIGESTALINEEAGTIFVSLPSGSDTVQEISWECWPNSEVYIEPVSIGSYTIRDRKDPETIKKIFEDYRHAFAEGLLSEEITMWIDNPLEDETITDIIILSGWALNTGGTGGTGVENVFVFDGPGMNIGNFLGVAVYGNPREDVAGHFGNQAFVDSGYSMEIDTTFLKNGKHELYIYAFDSNNNYSLQVLRVEVYNSIDFTETEVDLQKRKLGNNESYDFVEYIFHSTLETRNESSNKTYDLWVTTGDLPVVIIDTGGTGIPNYPKIDCSFQLLSSTDLPNYSTDKIKSSIEVRGGSSRFSSKKSYSFKFDRELSHNLQLNLLDMTNARKWILNSCFLDRTFMRDKVSYDLFNQMRDAGHYDYASETRFVEVFLNNSYSGTYLLQERIDEDLLELADYDADDELHSVVYKSYSSATSWQRWNPGTDGLPYSKLFAHQGYIQKEPNPVNSTRGNYWEPLLLFREFTIKSGDEYFSKYIEDELDINNIIDFYLLFSITGNPDGRLNNQYICRDNGQDSKFFFVPWDYNASFGRNAYTLQHDYTRWYYNGLTNRLLDTGSFRNKFKERWNELRKNVFTVENIHNMIDANMVLLADPQKRNFGKYPIVAGGNWQKDQYSDDYDFQEEIDYIKMWIDGRIRFLDHYINNNLGGESKENKVIDDNISIRITSPGLYSNVDSGFKIEGWAIDDTSPDSPAIPEVLIYYDASGSKSQLLGSTEMGIERPDVAEDLKNENYLYSGFEMQIEEDILKEGNNFFWVVAFDRRGNYNIDSFCINYIDD